MIKTLIYTIINAVIPMRSNEARVAELTLDELLEIRREGGLPYHDKRVTALIWELKYKANPHALKLAGVLLSEEFVGIAGEELGVPLLVPVPMHKEREHERGYNQTELLCQAAMFELEDRIFLRKWSDRAKRGFPRTFSREDSVFEYDPNILVRTRPTAPQQTLARSKRLHNVKNSMVVADTSKVKGRVCVVVDDVATTGATLAEAAQALKKAGARKVYEIALARS